MTARIGSRIDDVDVRMERVSRLIDSAARIDRELAAGLGCSASMTAIQGDIDVALAQSDTLQKAVRASLTQERSTRRRTASTS
ncbi:hypothetical protein [Nonomuraea gerenzanensis]|uniref:Uncharacterized protein n=1 Tax=Nonomuraea gerenzanensis TaxID=93944 RepID=A0A1M4BKV4_9ACTN|nr:hypothetical protein [Nonomuraea gerenzanensis]UBU19230.1 hypothetical protein LCN96_56370 [Nonomuraea gerenzanensis]SAP16249.1 hypothetical protein BN4615_P11055 [Nonomuraea gerenzanensis]